MLAAGGPGILVREENSTAFFRMTGHLHMWGLCKDIWYEGCRRSGFRRRTTPFAEMILDWICKVLEEGIQLNWAALGFRFGLVSF